MPDERNMDHRGPSFVFYRPKAPKICIYVSNNKREAKCQEVYHARLGHLANQGLTGWLPRTPTWNFLFKPCLSEIERSLDNEYFSIFLNHNNKKRIESGSNLNPDWDAPIFQEDQSVSFSGTASQFTCSIDISINRTHARMKIPAVWRGKLNICRETVAQVSGLLLGCETLRHP